MKFILQIEVDAPEHTGNPDFPNAVYAIQRLQNWLKDARQVQADNLMDTFAPNRPWSEEATAAYQKALHEEIRMIQEAAHTVQERCS